MACEHPKTIVNRRYVGWTASQITDYSQEMYGTRFPLDYTISVPCGYCLGCQKSSNNQYRIRLMYEIRCYPPGSCLFVTLTFDDEHLQRFESDTNKAVRLFLDRVRKRFGKQIRHWFIGEYGTERGRPHYHGILFDVPKELSTVYNVEHPGDHPVLRELWSYGFVFVGYVSDATCGYITKYLTKSLNGEKVRPRVITSKGIGASYLDTDECRLHKDGETLRPLMHLNGYPQALPRYYYNKIFDDVDKSNMVVDRFVDPPPLTWKGRVYPTEFARNAARRATFLSNVRDGLTPVDPPPTRRVVSSESRVREMLSNDDSFNFSEK